MVYVVLSRRALRMFWDCNDLNEAGGIVEVTLRFLLVLTSSHKDVALLEMKVHNPMGYTGHIWCSCSGGLEWTRS